MKNHTFTFEHLLYLLIFVLAFGVRGAGAGNLPLSDFEAEHAMRAVQVARGEPVELGNQPGYVLLTGFLFFITGSSEATARFWPMLMGSSLILLPFLLRHRLGRQVALITAVGLAIDPGLVAVSQLAGGPMMAVGFTLLAVITWFSGWTIVSGILAGLALLSGPAIIAGVAGLAGAAGIIRALGLFPHREEEISEGEPPSETGEVVSPIRAGLFAAGGTLLLAGTLFLRYPQGLSAFASALPAYFEGWVAPSSVPASRLLVVLISYPLLAGLFGLLGIVRSWMGQDEEARIGRALSIWFGVSLLLALLYPRREVADLAWSLVPLWGLAAIAFSPYLRDESNDIRSETAVSGNAVSWGLAGLVVVMLASAWINLAALIATNAQGQALMLRWLVVGGAILLVILSSILVGLGWSPEWAKRGLAWGTAMALGLSMFTGIWGATQREITARMELWWPIPGAGQQDLLVQTLGDLGDWSLGREDSIQIVSLVNDASVRWALRDMRNVRFQEALNREETPEVIITRQEQEDLSLGSAYRGQDFAWWVYPNWDVWTGQEWLKWLAFREATGGMQGVIVWARGDLFPSGEATLDPELPIQIDLTDEGEDFIPEEEIPGKEDSIK